MTLTALLTELQDLARFYPDAEVLFRDEEGGDFPLDTVAVRNVGKSGNCLVFGTGGELHRDCAQDARYETAQVEAEATIHRAEAAALRLELQRVREELRAKNDLAESIRAGVAP